MIMFKRYEADEQVIFYGDYLPILSSEIASNSVDIIFLDPPYNIGKHFADFYDKWESENDYINWANQILDHCLRILKPQGTLYVMAVTVQGGDVKPPVALTLWKNSSGAAEKEKNCLS
jgi:adenine-specific DNA-methyltransferase